jgi:ribonuclease-3
LPTLKKTKTKELGRKELWEKGFRFTNPYLLERALTHRSYLNEHPEMLEDNERLEFLGDAILDFLVGAWLYHHFPEMKEGELTKLRSALVQTDQLAEFARITQLGQVMLLGKGEEENGGRDRSVLLCDVFEAVIGAIYLDSDIQTVLDYLEPLLDDAVEKILEERSANDPKSILQEWAQSQGCAAPVYKLISASGPDHRKKFVVEVWIDNTCYGQAEGSSKRSATKIAAKSALIALGLE